MRSLRALFVLMVACFAQGCGESQNGGHEAAAGSAVAANAGAGGAGAMAGAGLSGSAGSAGSAGAHAATGGAAAGGSSGASTGSGGATGGGGSSSGDLAGSAGAAAAAGAGVDSSVNAGKLAADMGFGTNIGNTFDNTTTWETGWGEPLVTQAFINGLASRGLKTVRVPVAWDTYATNGVIDPTKLARVKEVVAWIEAAGMYSIVNIHWDGGWIFNENNANQFKLTSDVTTKFASYWTQIATGFSSVGNKLILEGLNEEGRFYINGDSNQAPDYAALNQLNQLFVTTVRAQSGYNKTRALLIAGFNTDIDLTCVDGFAVPTDPAGLGKLFLSIHYYTPYTFTGLDSVESWGSPATTWGTDAEQATLKSQFSKLAAFSVQKKLPVILGEFAVTRGEKYPRDPASRILWMKSVSKTALASGVVPVLWDTGSEIARTDGSFSAEFQAVMDNAK